MSVRRDQLLLFLIEPFRCALPIDSVQEVIRMVAVSPLPQPPPFVEGTINLRGTVIPVLDLRKRFNCPRHDYEARTRILIVTLNGRPAGLIVDDVMDVAEVPRADENLDINDSLEVDPGLVSGVVRVEGFTFAVLDLSRMLHGPEAEALRAIERAA